MLKNRRMKKLAGWMGSGILALSMAFGCAAQAEDGTDLTVQGDVIEVEKYGHAVLDITVEDFLEAGFALGDIVTVEAGSYSGDMPFFNGYYVDRGEYMLRAYPGYENIAVCINYGNFAETAGIGEGDPVTVTLKEKAGALDLQEINNLEYSKVRKDYDSDEIFANFRPVTVGRIGEGKLYRSASPVDDAFNRASYAYALMEPLGVNGIMNLADTEEELTERFEAEDFKSDAYRELYEAGGVIALGLPADFSSEEFQEGIVKGLTFLSELDPPYLVHCTEGKDRAGYASMMLEALLGADIDEITEDYMQSFVNYYKVEPDTHKYELIIEKNLMEMLKEVTGSDTPEEEDLQEAAEQYLIGCGMEEEAIERLQEKLSGESAENEEESGSAA